jgi:hypothetical protein
MVYHKETYIGYLKQHIINLFIIVNYNNELCQLVVKHHVYIVIL